MELNVRKYYYGCLNGIINFENQTDMGLKILSDSLARVLDVPDETKCVALNLNVSENRTTKRLILNGINFSPKRFKSKENEFRDRIIHLIEYCFGNNNFNNNFIFTQKKLKILRQMKGLLNRQDEEYNNIHNMHKHPDQIPFTLDEFRTYLFDKINRNNMNYSNRDQLHTLFITFFDIKMLSEIFPRHFEISEEFRENVRIFLPAVPNMHAEVNLVNELTDENNNIADINTYIGTSQTCCPDCSLFLHENEFDFRGSNSKRDRNWERNLNDLTGLDQNRLPILDNRRERADDLCQLVNKRWSNDMCHYLRYYQNTFNHSQDTLNTSREIRNIIVELLNHECILPQQ
jgi:uncharacterized short protein YbdD (DUF466 family)